MTKKTTPAPVPASAPKDDACCTPSKQSDCCAPADKAACCGDKPASCGCR